MAGTLNSDGTPNGYCIYKIGMTIGNALASGPGENGDNWERIGNRVEFHYRTGKVETLTFTTDGDAIKFYRVMNSFYESLDKFYGKGVEIKL